MTQLLAGEAAVAGLNGPYERRGCPACDADRPAKAAVASRPRAEDLAFEDLQKIWHGFFLKKAFFSYHRCLSCGQLYSPLYFGARQLDALYGRMPDNTAGMPVELLRRTQRGYFDVLKRHSSLRGAYVEVGPDIGLFTENCVREGRFNKYWLFEPNRAVLPALESLLAGKDFEIRPEFLDLDALPDAGVSTVVMVHVLDHVRDPKEMLASLKTKLAPGGVVAFVTHDESSLLARGLGAGWPAYCLQHPLLFDPATITNLLASAGYRVLEIRKTVNHFPALYLLKHFLFAVGLKGVSLPAWTAPAVPLRLGNILTVATPKAAR